MPEKSGTDEQVCDLQPAHELPRGLHEAMLEAIRRGHSPLFFSQYGS
jgi:hypothetical protein